MIEKMLDLIEKTFPLTELPCGDYEKLKVNGLTFRIRRFLAEGLGNVSVMAASGFLGLMNMDTLIITPTERDMPLLSYDRVLAMGNDTLIFELYDTLLGEADLSALDEAKQTGAHLPEHDLGSHWYDSIKLPQSISKKGKKAQRAEFDAVADHYLAQYLAAARNASVCDAAPKREKAGVYAEGLLTNGGPSTEVFKKGIGDKKTAELFRKVLFATEV